MAAALGWNTTLGPGASADPGSALADALWGAVAGYLSLWTVTALFKLATGKVGMGQGDFKLLAALGAWLAPRSSCRSCWARRFWALSWASA